MVLSVLPHNTGGPRTATSPLWAPQPAPWTHTPSRQHGHDRSILVAAAEKEAPVKYNKEFGYSRKDIIIITFGLIALGYLMYYGLQALGMEAGMAGNWVQMIIFLGICVGYISTYLFRVATKVCADTAPAHIKQANACDLCAFPLTVPLAVLAHRQSVRAHVYCRLIPLHTRIRKHAHTHTHTHAHTFTHVHRQTPTHRHTC